MRVDVHQGSVLSPILFIIILEALSREFRAGVPWEDTFFFSSVVPRARHCGIPAILTPMSLKNAPSVGQRAHLENLLIFSAIF